MDKDSSRPSGGDQEKIVAGIDQARQDLAGTMQALVAKADVPARVRDKAGQACEQITGTLSTLNSTARDKAPKARERVAKSITKVGRSIPEPARSTVVRTTRQATDAAEKRPAILYAVAGVCTAAGLWLWRRRRP